MLERLDHPEGIRELLLVRPPVNALDPLLIRRLREEVESVSRDGVRACVLGSKLEGRFSGGLDVPALLRLDREGMGEVLEDFFALLRGLAFLPCPSIAAINGHAPAGGAVLAIHCDLIVMAEGEFRMGLNEVQVGLPLPASIHAALVRRVGVQVAERLAVRGLLVPASEAFRVGFVDELVAASRLRERALELAREFAALPPQAMARTRALARRDLQTQVTALEPSTREAFLEDWFSAETQGALRALVERLGGGRAAAAANRREEGGVVSEKLVFRRCVPCQGGVPPLEAKQVAGLLTELGPNDWAVVNEHHLAKEYRFPDFVQALAFVNRVGEVAEQEGHHPDLFLSWGKVRIEIWTHKIDGLTESDFVLAAKCDQVYERLTSASSRS